MRALRPACTRSLVFYLYTQMHVNNIYIQLQLFIRNILFGIITVSSHETQTLCHIPMRKLISIVCWNDIKALLTNYEYIRSCARAYLRWYSRINLGKPLVSEIWECARNASSMSECIVALQL